MKLIVFLHGTLIMHRTGIDVSREERVKQSNNHGESVLEYATYVPIGNSVEKVVKWAKYFDIIYLSSHENLEDVRLDAKIIIKYGFPLGKLQFRIDGENYTDVVKRLMPDLIVEDDCESIGGQKEMVYHNLPDELKSKIKSYVVREFEGVDHLPDKL